MGRASTWRRAFLAVAVGATVFAAVAVGLWVLDSTDEAGETPGPAPATTAKDGAATVGVPPRIVSVARLREIARSSDRPLYWAGARSGTRIEYTQTADGSTHVRYLTGSAEAGNDSAGYVVVATYAQPNAYGRVSTIARKQGLSVQTLPNAGLAVTRPGQPRNAYVVYRGLPYQVEVYAPEPGQARELVLSGTIVPVG
jgi:hypothetical protein